MRLLLFFKIFDYTDITFILRLKILNITNKAKVPFDYHHPNPSFLFFVCVCFVLFASFEGNFVNCLQWKL